MYHQLIRYFKIYFVTLFFILPAILNSHGVPTGDQGYIQEVSGVKFVPFMYLGAKHMVTGYDHLLFLVGVIFFLYRLKDTFLSHQILDFLIRSILSSHFFNVTCNVNWHRWNFPNRFAIFSNRSVGGEVSWSCGV